MAASRQLATALAVVSALCSVGSHAVSLSEDILDPAERATTGVVMTLPTRHAYVTFAGYMVTTLTNGFLQCGTNLCQGNHGNAIPFTYRRSITP